MSAPYRVLDPAGGAQVPPALCALGVMTKAPRAGRVKTRLAPPLAPTEAAELNICFLRDLTTTLHASLQESPSRGVAIYTPAGAENDYAELLPPGFEMLLQRGEDFGQRLGNAIEDLFAVGFSAACLINSDSPTAPRRVFTAAAEALSRPGDRVVLGPSEDGGYYLIGLNQQHRELFEAIDWSTEKVLPQTMARAKKHGLEVHLLERCYDIDDRTTLRRLCDDLFGPHATAAPHTRRFLAEIIDREGRERIWPNE